jgi:hypothetical protein
MLHIISFRHQFRVCRFIFAFQSWIQSDNLIFKQWWNVGLNLIRECHTQSRQIFLSYTIVLKIQCNVAVDSLNWQVHGEFQRNICFTSGANSFSLLLAFAYYGSVRSFRYTVTNMHKNDCFVFLPFKIGALYAISFSFTYIATTCLSFWLLASFQEVLFLTGDQWV